MEQLFADRRPSESRLWLWLQTLADIGHTAPKEHWHILTSDIKYGSRVLAAAPSFTAIALLVIALGIGATVAIFSLADAVLLRSLPYGHADKLVYLWSPNVNLKGVPDELAPNVPDFLDWQRLSHSFSSSTMLRQSAQSLVREGTNVHVQTAYVTASFFRTMEARPAAGRSFAEDALKQGDDRAAVISHALWKSQFGSDAGIIGKVIQLNRTHYTVIGIMPEDFGYPYNGDIPYVSFESKQTDIWLPWILSLSEKTDRVNFRSADAAIGRLRDGVSAATAQAELTAIEKPLNALYPDMWKGWTALARPLQRTIIGPVEKMFWLLLGAVGLVLLIAISNVASLLLARATARAHELGIRAALGAERSRLVRQLLTEALLLSCAGGALGVALAYAAVRMLVELNPGGIPRFSTASVDLRVLAVALLLSVLTGALAGLLPALAGSRFSLNELLRRGGNRVGGSSHKGRFAFIIFEVALSVVLLAGSGLLIRSYLQLSAVDPGFSPSTLTFSLHLDERYNRPEQQAAFYRTFLAKVRALPGVQYAGASNSIPLSNSDSMSAVAVRGFGTAKEMVESRSVTSDYRSALGTLLLRGRDFNEHDLNSHAPVVMVNESFVKAYFHGRDALGGQVRMGIGDLSKVPWSTVIGIVADIRHVKLEEAGEPQVFQPVDNGGNFAVRCSGSVEQVIHEARGVLRSLDPALELGAHTMGERITEGNARRRFQTSLVTGFGAVSLAFTLAGLYGLMAYTVKQRTAEIGVRLAMGSPRGRVLRLILLQGLRVTACGLVMGIAGALVVTRLLSEWLFGVNAWDPATLIGVPLCVLTVTCGACLIPAWSATRIDPIQALRQE
jgi:predicted permease